MNLTAPVNSSIIKVSGINQPGTQNHPDFKSFERFLYQISGMMSDACVVQEEALKAFSISRSSRVRAWTLTVKTGTNQDQQPTVRIISGKLCYPCIRENESSASQYMTSAVVHILKQVICVKG